uniref:Protein EFR3 homolog cmp44E n=1 Tax=Cacopsylla melanoneura TaxID=428564 RepID=A0A8D8RWV8_9HEMI
MSQNSFLHKCVDNSCFTCLQPRYKVLINNIYPPNPEEGLIKNNMDKLTFYALSSPEKLDRIGDYLYETASRDISRKRTQYVIMSLEAMNQILLSCHAHALNLFIESFLKLIQKLLECHEHVLQILATQSFVKYANIEEDTPSYHRRYDFFISKFSSMCHDSDVELRMAGISGIQGIIRKTVSDDLADNIWKSHHLDKVIPSLLYNMHHEMTSEGSQMAETCLRELVGRAAFGHVKGVVGPVLNHLDMHRLWPPNEFAYQCFRILVFSVQSQYSYLIIESLLHHLNKHASSAFDIKTKIADVLARIIKIIATNVIGSTVLEITNSLLDHLKLSVCDDRDQELYEKALLTSIGELASNLPDYQKSEIMMFIVSKVNAQSNCSVQKTYLRALYVVSLKFTNISMDRTFPRSFLDPVLNMIQSDHAELRILVQQVFHNLLDRHGNAEKFNEMVLATEQTDVISEYPNSGDTLFLRKYGVTLFRSIFASLESPSNTSDNIKATYKTLALICCELVSPENVADYIAFVMNIQELASAESNLTLGLRNQLHVMVISLFSLVVNLLPLTEVKQYVDKVIQNRKSAKVWNLLPESVQDEGNVSENSDSEDSVELYLNDKILSEYFKSNKIEHGAMTGSFTCLEFQHRFTSEETDDTNSDVDSEQNDVNMEHDLSFETTKRLLLEPSKEKRKQLESLKQQELARKFRVSPFAVIMDEHTSSGQEPESLTWILNQVFEKQDALIASHKTRQTPPPQPIYETLFPQLFVY